jgi:hypothetical protein
MTYVSNTIRISTHVVNLWHHGLRFGERNPNRQWSRRKVNREEMRRKERRKKRERLSYSAHESHRSIWCDWCVSHTDWHDTTGLTCHSASQRGAPDTRQLLKSGQCIWRDSFINRVNQNCVTKRGISGKKVLHNFISQNIVKKRPK